MIFDKKGYEKHEGTASKNKKHRQYWGLAPLLAFFKSEASFFSCPTCQIK
jgi:hypothetical protein